MRRANKRVAEQDDDHERHALKRLVAIALGAAAIELTAAIVSAQLVRNGWMAAMPPLPDRPVIGFGPVNGPRHDPAFAPDAPPCISAYGDSFTYGAEAPDESTYPHDLGVSVRCRVANYGAGGYGADQALLLFRAQQSIDRAHVVILGHASEDIMRSVSQLELLLYPTDETVWSFKPRFTLTSGALTRIDPDRSLDDDYFFRTRPRRRFPYSFAIARWLLTDFDVRARVRGVARYADFYASDHPSGALPLTVAILTAFSREARAEGREPYVLLIPEAPDLPAFASSGAWIDQPLADALTRNGVRVIHGGPLLARRPDFVDPCAVYTGCHGHFTQRGYAALADVVRDAVCSSASSCVFIK